MEALHARFSELVGNPRQHPAVDEIHEGNRRCVCGRDSVYHRIDGEDVEIMAIIDQQDLNEWI